MSAGPVGHTHGVEPVDNHDGIDASRASRTSAEGSIAESVSGMRPEEILNFILELLTSTLESLARDARAGQEDPGRFGMDNPEGLTDNEMKMGLDGGEAANDDAVGRADGLRAPVYRSEAPPTIMEGLGSLADENGDVAAVNKGQHSGHAGHEMGHELNAHATYEAASAAGIDADAFVEDFVADDSNFNPGQTTEQKYVGAMTVLNDMTAAATMGGIDGDLNEVSSIAADATNAALDGDGEALRKILTDAGGDVSAMSDDMLLNTWGTNSHMYNHAILNTDSDPFALTHLRSLNDNASDNTVPGSLGFYNDKGAWPQWDAQTDAQRFLDEVIDGGLASSAPRTVGGYSPTGVEASAASDGHGSHGSHDGHAH